MLPPGKEEISVEGLDRAITITRENFTDELAEQVVTIRPDFVKYFRGLPGTRVRQLHGEYKMKLERQRREEEEKLYQQEIAKRKYQLNLPKGRKHISAGGILVSEKNYSDQAAEKLVAIRPGYHIYFDGMTEQQAQKLHDERVKALKKEREDAKKLKEASTAYLRMENEQRRAMGLPRQVVTNHGIDY